MKLVSSLLLASFLLSACSSEEGYILQLYDFDTPENGVKKQFRTIEECEAVLRVLISNKLGKVVGFCDKMGG